ncbi:Mitochondrial Translation Optimization [Globodera pallida]|nr:Mitochondrial Translation Optimization [Globodera pallida]
MTNALCTKRWTPLKNDWHRKYCYGKASTSIQYDVIVIGGGHGGCEAAAAASRTGARTLLVTHSKEKVGEMSCNPSFGGIGKGHLMREIDALDGVCPRICDQTGFHFHVLNRRHGPAVLGLRALIDRKLYKSAMQEEIFRNTPNLDVLEAAVEDLFLDDDSSQIAGDELPSHRVKGCVLGDGRLIIAPTVVITTGTFLNGLLVWGGQQKPGGRIGEASSSGLAKTFRRIGFRTGRLSTGTPPRLLASTIDFSRFTIQPSDDEPIPFSFLNKTVGIPREKHRDTYVGYTDDRLTKIVCENVDENHSLVSALNEGIKGPRYCPSLEAKCLRFGHLKHRVFLEPEGLDSELIYPQGCALGFSIDMQQKIMRCIDGLERVEVVQPGYSVRYDFVHPQQLWPSLETKKVNGLFLAGQINGTTGYEEAAAQGLIAGVNASIRARHRSGAVAEFSPLILDRTKAYIGVMIDDLISLGVTEPYRMYTSRAENRLFMRPDNADLRLTEKGRAAGLVGDERWVLFERMQRRLDVLRERLLSLTCSLDTWNARIPGLNSAGRGSRVRSAQSLLAKHPELHFDRLAMGWPELFSDFADDRNLEERLRNEHRYANLELHARTQVESLRKEMDMALPDDLDYLNMDFLRPELRESLHERRPNSLAAAAKVPGINDTAMYFLLQYVKSPKDKC